MCVGGPLLEKPPSMSAARNTGIRTTGRGKGGRGIHLTQDPR